MQLNHGRVVEKMLLTSEKTGIELAALSRVAKDSSSSKWATILANVNLR